MEELLQSLFELMKMASDSYKLFLVYFNKFQGKIYDIIYNVIIAY